jgi:hypothetical protein
MLLIKELTLSLPVVPEVKPCKIELSVIDIALPIHTVDVAQVLAMEIVRKAKN